MSCSDVPLRLEKSRGLTDKVKGAGVGVDFILNTTIYRTGTWVSNKRWKSNFLFGWRLDPEILPSSLWSTNIIIIVRTETQYCHLFVRFISINWLLVFMYFLQYVVIFSYLIFVYVIVPKRHLIIIFVDMTLGNRDKGRWIVRGETPCFSPVY